jgi:uncharacterized membrane protein
MLALAGCHRSTGEAAATLEPEASVPAPGAARSGVEAPAATTAPDGALLAYAWDCEDGTSLVVTILPAEDAVAVELPEGSHRLRHDRSASGPKYEDDGLAFWNKGATATFQRGDKPAVTCREVRAKSLVADARARGVIYRGQGNEPGWVLEIGPSGSMVFVTSYGQERHEFTGATSDAGAGVGERFRAGADGEQIAATVKAEACLDDMAGTPFDYSVVVEFGGRTYRGCARRLR